MQIQFQGRTYSYDETKIDINQAYVIKANTGWTIRGWQENLEQLDPHAIAHLWWIILAQNGETRNIADLGNFPVVALMVAIGEAAEAEQARQTAGQPGGPTPPAPASPPAPNGAGAPTAPIPGSTPTSGSSAANTSSSSPT